MTAQPGFSALVRVTTDGRERTILFDTGVTPTGVVENMRRPDPLILDDQAIVLRLPEGGLLVLTGCGHAGIINIVRHAQQLTGETRIAAVIGGFHLMAPMFEPILEHRRGLRRSSARTLDASALHGPEGSAPACGSLSPTRSYRA